MARFKPRRLILAAAAAGLCLGDVPPADDGYVQQVCQAPSALSTALPSQQAQGSALIQKKQQRLQRRQQDSNADLVVPPLRDREQEWEANYLDDPDFRHHQEPQERTVAPNSTEPKGAQGAQDAQGGVCATVADSGAYNFAYALAEPGTPCVFGLDPRDEGWHCIKDDDRAGFHGWCWVSSHAWGSCNQLCPTKLTDAQNNGDFLDDWYRSALGNVSSDRSDDTAASAPQPTGADEHPQEHGDAHRACTTRFDERSAARGESFLHAVSPPGTPCLFGVDRRDGGAHCIMDGGRYGEFGWCWTSSTDWGSCDGSCSGLTIVEPTPDPATPAPDAEENKEDEDEGDERGGDEVEARGEANDHGNRPHTDSQGSLGSSCRTRADERATSMRYQTAPPNTPCAFGLDPRDEGAHCIFDGGKYGSFGWCWTSNNTFGSCGEHCPLFGHAQILERRIDRLSEHVDEVGERLPDQMH